MGGRGKGENSVGGVGGLYLFHSERHTYSVFLNQHSLSATPEPFLLRRSEKTTMVLQDCSYPCLTPPEVSSIPDYRTTGQFYTNDLNRMNLKSLLQKG